MGARLREHLILILRKDDLLLPPKRRQARSAQRYRKERQRTVLMQLKPHSTKWKMPLLPFRKNLKYAYLAI